MNPRRKLEACKPAGGRDTSGPGSIEAQMLLEAKTGGRGLLATQEAGTGCQRSTTMILGLATRVLNKRYKSTRTMGAGL